MDELRLRILVAAEANLRTASLEILKIGAGAYLHIAAVAGHPDLDIIGLCGAEAEIAGAEAYDTVGKAETLKHAFGVVREFFKLRIAILGLCEFDELDLVELVLTYESPRITARAACLAAEACAVRAVFNGKLIAVKDVSPVQVGNGYLCGRDEEIIRTGDLESILLKFRELTRARHGSPVHHVRRQYLGIAVIGMAVEEIADDGAFEPCAETAVNGEPCARNLACGCEIKDFQVFADVPMRFGFKIEFGGLAVAADLRIIPVIRTVRYALMGDIGYLHEHIVKLGVYLGQLGIERLDLIRNLLHLGKYIACIKPLLFEHRDFCAVLIALRLEGFDLNYQLAAFFVKLQKTGNIRALVAA